MYETKKKYFYGTGRRKSSVARVRVYENGTGSIIINGREINDYFGLDTLKLVVNQPLVATDLVGKVDVVVTVANLLRGKHKVDFTPNVDCGDFVIVINTDKAILTGKKLEQKTYYRVSGWIGGLKETKARVMMENRSDYAMELAVKGMLPKNTLGRNALTRLHLYKGEEHPHAAQKPEAWTL